MAGSGYVYCFNECPLPWLKNNTQYGSFAGVVGVDHYYTNQGACRAGRAGERGLQGAVARLGALL